MLNVFKERRATQKRSFCYPEAERHGRFLQVIHLHSSSSGHWILASNIGGEITDVTVYVSLNNAASGHSFTTNLLKRLLKNSGIKIFVVHPQIQDGCNDCGLFALAFCTALANGEDLSSIKFDQSLMRKHLQICFENKHLVCFPKL